MFTLSSSARLPRHQTFTKSSSSMKKKNDGRRKCTVTIDASSSADSKPTRRDAVVLVSSSILYAALPALAFGGSKEAKPDPTTARDAKKAAILAAARAKAEGQAAKITEEEPRKELQSAEFFDASNSGAGVRGGGADASFTYDVAKEEAPAAPAAPEPAAPAPEPAAPAPEPAAPAADEGGFSLPSVSLPSLPSLPKLPF